MTPRERVLAILNRKKPDMVPWFGDLAYWIDYLNDEGLMPEKYKEKTLDKKETICQGLASPFTGKGLFDLHDDLGVGFYLQGYFPFTARYENVKITENVKGNKRITIIETPHGNLQEVWEYVYSTHSWGPKEYMIKGYEDLKKLRYLFENTYYEPDYKLARDRYEMIGSNGVVLCYLPKSSFMEMVALRAGIEQVTYMLLDAKEEMEETLSLIEKKHDEASEIALNSPAECLMIPENISSESIGKNFYNLYMRGYHEKWIKRIREKKKYSFVHLDGTMKGLIRELSDVGFDVIEAITPAPVGDIEIEDVHKWVNKDTVIWGGIPGGYFTDKVSDKEFDEFVIHVIEIMRSEPRYVLSVGDQVVPGSSFERVKRVGELVRQYGKY
ncbi:MAG: uroporphyrinogen decarboxylase family protein [Acetivibrionales bacterium]|jgi:hypothetical protein